MTESYQNPELKVLDPLAQARMATGDLVALVFIWFLSYQMLLEQKQHPTSISGITTGHRWKDKQRLEDDG